MSKSECIASKVVQLYADTSKSRCWVNANKYLDLRRYKFRRPSTCTRRFHTCKQVGSYRLIVLDVHSPVWTWSIAREHDTCLNRDALCESSLTEPGVKRMLTYPVGSVPRYSSFLTLACDRANYFVPLLNYLICFISADLDAVALARGVSTLIDARRRHLGRKCLSWRDARLALLDTESNSIYTKRSSFLSSSRFCHLLNAKLEFKL